MDFADSPIPARGPARAAIQTMKRNGIPAHPVNFSIWYAYHSGDKPAYCRALDLLLANGAALTEARCEAIFRRHFVCEDGAGVPTGLARDESTAELAALVHDVRRETRRVVDKTKALDLWLARTARHLARHQDRMEETLGGDSTDSWADSWTDPLTGLANRAGFEAQLGTAVAGLWRSGGGLSLVIADIDRFTAFNERYGRTLGDEVLHALGAAFKGRAHGSDTAARFDGNAFAIIRPGAALDEAVSLGEKLRRRLESCKLVNAATGESYGRLTVSVGVAQYHLGEPTGDFVRRAEQALFQAKAEGRNRVSARAPGTAGS